MPGHRGQGPPLSPRPAQLCGSSGQPELPRKPAGLSPREILLVFVLPGWNCGERSRLAGTSQHTQLCHAMHYRLLHSKSGKEMPLVWLLVWELEWTSLTGAERTAHLVLDWQSVNLRVSLLGLAHLVGAPQSPAPQQGRPPLRLLVLAVPRETAHLQVGLTHAGQQGQDGAQLGVGRGADQRVGGGEEEGVSVVSHQSHSRLQPTVLARQVGAGRLQIRKFHVAICQIKINPVSTTEPGEFSADGMFVGDLRSLLVTISRMKTVSLASRIDQLPFTFGSREAAWARRV